MATTTNSKQVIKIYIKIKHSVYKWIDGTILKLNCWLEQLKFDRKMY